VSQGLVDRVEALMGNWSLGKQRRDPVALAKRLNKNRSHPPVTPAQVAQAILQVGRRAGGGGDGS